MEGKRILHIMSPVKWDNNTYLNNADANFKVLEKTIKFLPNNHHYILVPAKHNIGLYGKNITFIRYNYPRSIHLNRGLFNHRDLKFDFTKTDIDFVFLHQPELAYNVELWLSANRYHRSVKIIGFFHWIDCPANTYYNHPAFYMRQLEAMTKLDTSFIHTDKSLDWLASNFKDQNTIFKFMNDTIKRISYFPLSGTIDDEMEAFQLPNKKILVFNHRWGKSSGIKRLLEYTKDLPDDYVIWVTDEKCDIKNPKFIVKALDRKKYNYLMANCHAGLCFIDRYATWNLAVQDAPLHGRPVLYYDNPIIGKVLTVEICNKFISKEEFIKLVVTLNSKTKYPYKLEEHDQTFKENLLDTMNVLWKDTDKPTVNMEKWLKCIEQGMSNKYDIAKTVMPNVDLNSAYHFIRRNLLHRGVKDDINSPFTKYYKGDVPPEDERIFG